MKKTSIVVLTLFILSFNIFAENTVGTKDSVKYVFNPVVVTATKFQGPQKEIASSVTVIDQAAIDHATTNSVLELVSEQVPGVHITEKNIMGYGVASGAAGGISIRGVGGSPVTGVLVLRDGRPDIMGMMGHPIPDAYSLDGVERVEVVRGPASFLYGTNAMGGVINIVSSKVKKDGFTSRISGGMGNFGIQKLSGFHGGKFGGFEYYVTAATRSNDGHRDYSGYEGDFYTAHASYQVLRSTNIAFNANLSNIYMFDPGTEENPFIDHWYDLKRSGADLTIDHKSGLGESFLKLHGNFGKHKIYDGWRSNDQTIGVMFYHNIQPFTGNMTTAGFDVKQYGGDAEESLGQVGYIDYSEHSISEWAPYIHTQQMIMQNIIASAGVRMENHELYGQELLPKVGLVIRPLTHSSLRMSAAKGFRSPAIRELYVFPPRNEELDPERMWNYEVGVGQDLGNSLNVEASLFRSEGENMIRTVMGQTGPSFTNSGEFTHSGYEISVKWLPIEKLNITTNWAKLDLGDETRETPGKKLSATASYALPFTSLSATVVHAMDIYGSDNRLTPMEDYTLLHVSALINPPIPFISFKVSARNLLDAEYQTVYGYPMPGRTLMFDMNVGI